MGGLQPLGDNLNSECRALAQALRELFSELAVSVRRCAARCYVDAGTLSRYLAGTRVPPADFVDDFLRHIEDVRGTRIERAARERLRVLRLAALRTTLRSAEPCSSWRGS